MNKEQRKILDDYTGYVIKRIKQFRFQPPLDVDECTNYVLYKIVDRIGNYDKKINSVLPFLNRVTTNLVLDYYRKLNKTDFDEIDAKILEQIEPDKNSPEKDYWQDKRDSIIKEEIDNLQGRYKKIITEYYYEDKTLEQIGNMFNLTKGRIRQLVKEAEHKIKKPIDKRLKELDEIRSEL